MGGKGKGKQGGGHLLPRTRITAEKFTGTCSAWKGKYGWIVPAEQVEHEKAHLHNGSLYVRLEDLEGFTELTPGAPCEFHITEDDSGLGAEEVVETGEADPDFVDPSGKGKANKGASKGASVTPAWQKGASPAKGAGKAYSALYAAPSKGAAWGAKGWGADPWAKGKGVAKGAPWEKGWGKGAPWEKGGAKGYGKPVMNGFEKGKGKKGDGKKGDGKKGVGHKLPRTRISEEKFTGTVKAWKGKFGFIQPAEEIEHELASKHGGALFFGLGDMDGDLTEIAEGANVEFHIWEDSTGLGADEVVEV